MVIDYAGLNLLDVLDLDYDIFLLLLRDSVIYSYSKTIEGQEYLEKCYNFNQTKPDRENLRNKFKKKGGKI